MRSPAAPIAAHRTRWIVLLVAAITAALAVWTYNVVRMVVRVSERPPATQRNAVPIGSLAMPSDPLNASELSQAERRRIVEAAIGPAPSPDAVPVLGYTTKGGITYRARWRTPPDADRTNNFKTAGQR